MDTLRSWTIELGLWCRLVIGQRRILLVIASSSTDEPHNPVKTFEKRLRTCKVDVDSRGRPCKERMAKVLCECEIVLGDFQSGSFEVKEVDDLEVAFAAMGLLSVYEKFV